MRSFSVFCQTDRRMDIITTLARVALTNN